MRLLCSTLLCSALLEQTRGERPRNNIHRYAVMHVCRWFRSFAAAQQQQDTSILVVVSRVLPAALASRSRWLVRTNSQTWAGGQGTPFMEVVVMMLTTDG
jgi:hypothetical protein